MYCFRLCGLLTIIKKNRMTTIDTHALFKELIASGMPKRQAEIISHAVLGIHDIDKVTTKEQFTFLEKEMATKVDLMKLKTELKSEIMEVKTEIIGIQRDIKWIMILLVAILGISMKNTFF